MAVRERLKAPSSYTSGQQHEGMVHQMPLLTDPSLARQLASGVVLEHLSRVSGTRVPGCDAWCVVLLGGLTRAMLRGNHHDLCKEEGTLLGNQSPESGLVRVFVSVCWRFLLGRPMISCALCCRLSFSANFVYAKQARMIRHHSATGLQYAL